MNAVFVTVIGSLWLGVMFSVVITEAARDWWKSKPRYFRARLRPLSLSTRWFSFYLGKDWSQFVPAWTLFLGWGDAAACDVGSRPGGYFLLSRRADDREVIVWHRPPVCSSAWTGLAPSGFATVEVRCRYRWRLERSL